jgi:carboxylesterase
MGAVLSLRLAAEKQGRVKSLVLMSTTLAYDGWAIPWYRFLLPLALYTPLKYFWSYREGGSFGVKNEAIRRRVSAMMNDKSSVAYARTPANSIREMLGLIKATKYRLSEISSPTLILHAAEDEVASPGNAEFIEQNLGAVHIEKKILDNCYHLITIDNQRNLVAAEVARFITEFKMKQSPALAKVKQHSNPGNLNLSYL